MKWTPEIRSRYIRDNWIREKGKKKLTKVIKDRFPDDGNCVLCHKRRSKRLYYHHFGKIVPSQYLPGLWLCYYCHDIAEAIDNIKNIKNMMPRYLKLKQQAIRKAPKVRNLLSYVH